MDDVDLLRGLVAEYSPPGQETRAVQRFVELSRTLGLTAETDGAGNGIARIGVGSPTLLFLGHIDTVEGELPIRLVDGQLWGRGTCDAKGALAAGLVAASRHDGPGEIVVVAAVGEERDSRGARYLLNRHRPDVVIVGEPSGWDAVTVGYKGTLSLVLHLRGERAHLSSPTATTVETGLSVVERLREFCETLQGQTPFHSLTMKVHSVHTIRSGSHEQVEIGLNFRLPPGLRTDTILDFLDGVPDVRYELVDRSDAVEVSPRNEAVRALCAGIRSEGRRPTLLRKLGTSDLNLAEPAWQCPAAAYGPGDSHLDHTDQEHLEIEEFRRSIEVLHLAFARLTSREPARIAVATMDAP
jgi:LysW-gamma-L-lysine carboxypeptidase